MSFRRAGIALTVLSVWSAAPAAADNPQEIKAEMAAAFQASLWCLQGATLTVGVTVALAAPAALTGAGSPIAATQLAGAAGLGCGFGILWGVTSTGARWISYQLEPFLPRSKPSAVVAEASAPMSPTTPCLD